MAIVTPSVLSALNTMFRGEYQKSFAETPSDYADIATTVPSSAASNTYGWLGQFPKLREWVGERTIKSMAAHGYAITNKIYEGTVGVKRTDIEDDSTGVYKPLFSEMGRAAKVHPDEITYGLLKAALATPCYDGQNFLDTDHPVYPNVDGTGEAATVANLASGAGALWLLMDTSRVIRPLIFQERTKPELTAMTKVDDESVFMADEYRYGVRYRCNAGFGLWQLCYGSKLPLNTENFNAAYTAMTSFLADGGRPLGVTPTLLVVPPSLRTAAQETVSVSRLANGADNPNAGVVKVKITPWLL